MILEGIKNNIFKKEDVEIIARERMEICRTNTCGFYDSQGISEKVIVKGVPSCAHCGCNLGIATRSLAYSCPVGKWERVLTDMEEAYLNEKLMMGKPESL
jgi:hypothetical protein